MLRTYVCTYVKRLKIAKIVDTYLSKLVERFSSVNETTKQLNRETTSLLFFFPNRYLRLNHLSFLFCSFLFFLFFFHQPKNKVGRKQVAIIHFCFAKRIQKFRFILCPNWMSLKILHTTTILSLSKRPSKQTKHFLWLR